LDILSIIVTCILYFYGLVSFYIAFLAKKRNEKEAFINNFVNSVIFIISITINILINSLKISNIGFIVFPFDILMIIFVIFFLPHFSLTVNREKRKVRLKETHLEDKNSNINEELPFKYELYRKLTHLVVLGIAFFYFTLGFLVQNIFIYILEFFPNIVSEFFFSIYNIEANKMIFTQYLVVFLVGVSLIGLLTADFVRILKPNLYPLKPVNQILRKKERQMRLGPHISMGIGCFSIILLFGPFQPIGPIVICTSMTMSIFGDMTANLVGRKFGVNKIRNTKKSYEGLIAGMSVAYISGFITLIFINQLYPINFFSLIILPSVGTFVIGFLDYLDLDVDDNLSYNFVLSTTLFIISLFILEL
jgi:CDP-diglyceride synthetase